MSDPKNSTISSSELSMLLLGSSSALPTTGNIGATKEWAEGGGKSRPTNSSAQSWERSGRGLNTVEASQLLKEQALGVHHKIKPSTLTARYRKTEMKGGREGLVQNYHLLLDDLSKKNALPGKDVVTLEKGSEISSERITDSVIDDTYHSGIDQSIEKSLLGKRPYSESCTSDDDDDECSSVSSRLEKKNRQEDDSSSDEVDARRNRARFKAMQRRAEPVTDQSGIYPEGKSISSKMPLSSDSSDSDQSKASLSTDYTSDSDSSASSSTSASNEATLNLMRVQSAKPIFVPKSQRLSAAEQRQKEKDAEDQAKLKQMRKESEVQKSRHLLATVVANDRSGDRSSSLNDGCLGEFSETGGNILPPPDDNDDYDEDISKQEEYAVKSREEWEVRELMRIMREVEEKIKHLEGEDQHQRQLIKRESHESSEKKNTNSDKSQSNYLQRYYHRGAFYLDEDTLQEAGPADVRHKAAEYARAATLEDKIDKTKLPQVMQVKKFGFAGYSTKYKGLKMEDTTDKDITHVPITKKGTGSR